MRETETVSAMSIVRHRVPATDELMATGAPRCADVRADGNPCGGFAIAGSRYCFAHDPAQHGKRAVARRRGGQAGRVATLPESSVRVRSMADVLCLVEESINDVRTGRVDVRVANAVGYLATIALRAIEQGDLADRLAALEAVLAPERQRRVAARRSAA